MPFCNTDVPVSLANRNDNCCNTDVSFSIRICLWVHWHRLVLLSSTLYSLALIIIDNSIASPTVVAPSARKDIVFQR